MIHFSRETIKALGLAALGLWLLSGCSLLPSKFGAKPEPDAVQADSLRRTKALDYFLDGSVRQESGELPQAAYKYQLAFMFDSTSAPIPLALAKVYLDLGEVEAAILTLEAGTRLNPRDEELYSLLSSVYIRQGDISSAARTLKNLADIRPLTSSELLQRAAIQRRIGDFRGSVNSYNEFLERFAPRAEVYEDLGKVHLLRKDIESAQKAFEKLVALDPNNHRVLYVLGGFAVSRLDWKTAEGYFAKAVAKDSTEIRYWTNLLLALNAQDKYSDIIKVCDSALQKFPQAEPLFLAKAGALERLQRFDEALECLDRALELDESDVSPYLTKGFIYHQLKRWEDSAAAYEEALARAPDNPLVLNNYAYMLSVSDQRLEDALEMVRKALAKAPDNPSYIDTYGWILYRSGNYPEALKEIKKALKKQKKNAELFEHLGYIYQALDEPHKARAAWKRALELEPDNKEYRKLNP
ncbi:MAG: tetratricopeptide repeat protein [Calditrichota bacterium]